MSQHGHRGLGTKEQGTRVGAGRGSAELQWGGEVGHGTPQAEAREGQKPK